MKALLGLTFIGAALAGYILNIISLIQVINDPLTVMPILRIVGIFLFPIGVVLGFF